MTQESLDFGRLSRVGEYYKRAFHQIENAIDQVGLIVAAGATGMKSPDLSKTFEPNSGRHLRLHTSMAIGAVSRLDARRAIITPIAASLGFDVLEHKPMDDKEKAIRLEEALKRLGPLGEQALRDALGGRL
jgi:hypothetical protein